MISTQDFVKGADFTGESTISPTLLNQLVDSGYPVDGKGLTIVTRDTALNTPEVPNATVTTKWKNYIWIRLPHADDDSVTPALYLWNDESPSVTTYLKWTSIVFDQTVMDSRLTAVEIKATNNSSDIKSINAVLGDTTLSDTVTNTVKKAAEDAASAKSDVSGKVSITNLDTEMDTVLKRSPDSASKVSIEAFVKTDITNPLDTRISNLEGLPSFSLVKNAVRFSETAESGGNPLGTVTGGNATSGNILRSFNTATDIDSPIAIISSGKILIRSSGTYLIYYDGLFYFNPTGHNSWYKCQLALQNGSTFVSSANSQYVTNDSTSVEFNYSVSGMTVAALTTNDLLSLVLYFKKQQAGDTISAGVPAGAGVRECYANVILLKLG